MPNRHLALLATLLVLSCAFFLFWDLKGQIGFIFELRAVKLATLLLVGAAVGVSTVLFQTLTGNKILTPAIMGFDALFLLIETSLIFFLGAVDYLVFPDAGKFLLETGVMMVAAMALFGLLLGQGRQDLHRMILVGVIFGVLFRSLTAFMQRMIDPSEFSIVQGAMFVSFGNIDRTELIISAALCLLVFATLTFYIRKLDVIALGRETAVGLGINYDGLLRGLLALVAILVSVSTALVGPITFLGLLVANLAYLLMPTYRHAILLPAAGMIAALLLVLGQSIFERVLHLQSTLSVIIELFGGILFLYLILRRRGQ
ncbi:MAG: iron chelate uptake ABC transporter family permease subunit [Parvibaculaceae bacterium]|nr:iron chelate uptake ABC transporter family permease subunit [Parvibaculaceae bacterium]